MENLNIADSNTSLTASFPIQDAPLDSVPQSHVHEIPKTHISSSPHRDHNHEERENKGTRLWNGTWSNHNTHQFPRTYHKDNNAEGYDQQIQHGYNGRGPFSRNYPNEKAMEQRWRSGDSMHNRYLQARTYHRYNIRTSAQPYGYHVHRYHDWNALSTEQHHGRNYVAQSRTYHRDNIKNATHSSYDRQLQPWSNDRQREWTNDREGQPWSNDRQQEWTNDREGQPWTNDKQWHLSINDRIRQPWTNDRQQQPWSNNGEILSHGYHGREIYSLQNGARPYRYPERREFNRTPTVASHGPQNGVGQYRFPDREPRFDCGINRFASNLNAADSLVITAVSFGMPPVKNDQVEKPREMWPVPCEGNMSLNQIELRNEKFEHEAKQEIEGSLVHEQAPILRVLNSCLRKKLLILDVNGLLADVIFPPPKEDKADINIYRRAIFKRPFVSEFLKFCFERFDVAIWSSRTKKILDSIVDYLLVDMRCKLLFCWDQSHCTKTGFRTLENNHKELLLKEIKKVWEKHEADLPYEKGYYDESNTLLLDDSPYKALLNPMHTAIFPRTYSYKDTSDNSLGSEGDLRVYLTGLVTADNVKKYVEEHPFGQQPIDEANSSWEYYLNVITSQTLVQPQA